MITTTERHVQNFNVEDLFLSRTDPRGIIQSGNIVFQRVSGFEWDELLGAPHKIVRHPDMPKAVFWHMWEELKAGSFFGGYVKNRSKNGEYYWVFAVAVPIKDGFLSVRLKPTTKMIDKVADIYARACAAEDQGVCSEEGFTLIEDAIKDLGFRDYNAFAGYMAGEEWNSRALILGGEESPHITKYRSATESLLNLAEEVEKIRILFNGIRNSPTNLAILGSRLSSGREPMQVVAQNYKIISDEILNAFSNIGDGLTERLDSAISGQLAQISCALYREAIDHHLSDEPNRGSKPHNREVQTLFNAFVGLVKTTNAAGSWVDREVKLFSKEVSRLRRMLSGLVVTRITCRIESAASQDETKSISEIVSRLEVFQEELSRSLDRISSTCQVLSKNIPQTIRQDAIDALANNIEAVLASQDLIEQTAPCNIWQPSASSSEGKF